MVCLDTSFVVDLLRGKSHVRNKMDQLDRSSETIGVTSPTIMELVSGANLSSRISSEKEKVKDFLSGLLILNLDKESAFLAGDIEANLIKKGEIIEAEDIMIAAIAITNNESLLTGNMKHFERIDDLKIESY